MGTDTDSVNTKITERLNVIIPFDPSSLKQLEKQLMQYHESHEKAEFLKKIARDIYDKKEQQFGSVLTRRMEKFVMLGSVDRLWMDHLDAIDDLRQGIGLRGYAQKDPLVEYKNEAFKMFEQLVFAIDDEVVNRIFKIQPQIQPHQHAQGHTHTNEAQDEKSLELRTKSKKQRKDVSGTKQDVESKAVSTKVTKKLAKPGRNDPCWCGSGKKYKKCHYPN